MYRITSTTAYKTMSTVICLFLSTVLKLWFLPGVLLESHPLSDSLFHLVPPFITVFVLLQITSFYF